MRKYLTGGFVLMLALAVGLVGTAAAKSTFTSNGHEQGIDAAIEDGGNQLTARSGPLALTGEDYLAPDNRPKKAGRVQLLFDEGIKLNTTKFPACSTADVQNMEGTSSADAKALCGKAQVSLDGPANSQATAAIGAVSPLIVFPEVTAFNGPQVNGNPSLILHAFLSSPVANTTVLIGELKQVGGHTLLDVNNIPPLAGGAGSLTDFYSTINAETKDKKAIKKAKKKVRKAKKKVRKAKKKVRKASGKKAKKRAKKQLRRAKKQLRRAKKQLRRARRQRINYIEASCTGGSYETEGTWNIGEFTNPGDPSSFVTEFVINGTDSVACSNNNETAPFDPGPGRG